MKICIIGSHQKGYDETCRIIRRFVKDGWEVLSPGLETKHDEGLVVTMPRRHLPQDLKKAFNQADVIYIAYSGESLEADVVHEISLAAEENKPLYASASLPMKEIAEKVHRICPPEDVRRLLALSKD